ncbi:hypothetical protein GCM10020331_066100 [Ectobacillus funiculus]
MKESPLVSLLVPCYNEEETVRETIAHLLNLNYPNYEIIMINDGSTDGTAVVAKELALKHKKNVRFIDLQKKILEKRMRYILVYLLHGENSSSALILMPCSTKKCTTVHDSTFYNRT